MHRTSLHFIADIREALCAIQEYTKGMACIEFTQDRKTRDAVIRNLEIIGEATKNLPEDLKARYPHIAWKRIAGLRDVVAHGYFRVDYELIFDIVTRTLPVFGVAIETIENEEINRETRITGG